MKKIVFLSSLLLISALPFVASATVTCRDTIQGCSLEQNLELIKQLDSTDPLFRPELLSILQETVKQLMAKLAAATPAQTTASSCLNLNHDLLIDINDELTEGEVSKLQRFLVAQGVYPEARIPGYYGTLPARAVMRWQKAHGMDFVTQKSGVGPMTRGKMACTQTITQCPAYDSKPVINSINPTSGPVGTTIEIQGCNFLGFEGDKYIWFTNNSEVKGVMNGATDTVTHTSNTTLRVTLPAKLCQVDNSYSGLPCPASLDIVPGIYTLYTHSYGGNSNVVNFTVTP